MEKLLNANEVAEILAVTPVTVRIWAKTRKINSIRPGGDKSRSIRFRESDIIEILNSTK